MSGSHPRIVVDARMAHDGGIGTYLQALLPRIASIRPHWSFAALGDATALRGLGWEGIPNVRLVDCRAPIFSIREQLELPLRGGAGSADLYWAPHYNVPLLLRGRFALTIHDVNHLALPELMGGPLRSAYARRLLTAAVQRATRVVFVSKFTQEETARVLGEATVRGAVVHSAAGEEWSRARELAPNRPRVEPYFLYVGNIKRHKNVPFLLRAFRRIQGRIPHRLVLIGRAEGLRADPEVARELSLLGNRAEMLGEVSKDVVRQFVVHAHALVTASLYEGFGLPPLEAMAAGCPCLVSAAGSLPEVCGDAALYGDPRDEASFAAGMVRLADQPSLRDDLIARGRARAAQFSWERSAAATARVLEDALS